MPNSLIVIHIIELIAALAGTYYYLKTTDKKMKIFVWYLWVVVFVETLAMYGYVLENNYDMDWFIWLKNSVLCSNIWLFNLFSIATIFILGRYYYELIEEKYFKYVIKTLVFIVVSISIGYYIISGEFFSKSIQYSIVLETIVIFVFVMFHYRQLLNSNKLLNFYRLPEFYVSSGLLLFYLCVTPIFIFNGYIYEENTNFIEFRSLYLMIVNVFLYTCFTFGFLYTLQFKKQ